MEGNQGPLRPGVLQLPPALRRDILIVVAAKLAILGIIYQLFFAAAAPSDGEPQNWLGAATPVLAPGATAIGAPVGAAIAAPKGVTTAPRGPARSSP